MTTRDVIAAARLPRHECERLLMHVTGETRSTVAAGAPLSDEDGLAYGLLCRRRVEGEPLQYLEGSVPFGAADILVDQRVLIPRPETEYLWEKATLSQHLAPAVVVDLCTGSGALAVALSLAFPDADVWATDISADALDVARINAEANEASVSVRQGDMFAALPEYLKGQVELFVSNPPYVDPAAELPSEVADWEPRLALVADDEGRALIQHIADNLAEWLAPDAWFFIEIGEEQGAVAKYFGPDFADVHVEADLAGRPRYVVGRRS